MPLPGDTTARTKATSVVDRFDRVFWLGDLNYRVKASRRMADVLLKDGMLEVLIANDQLRLEMARGTVFVGFAEGDLTFLPTYKYDDDCDTYDTSAKMRVPSWTDRVLWKRNPNIKLLEYNSVQTLRISDHRPVYATFLVNIGGVIPTKQRVLHTRICALM
eukprot:TRINITY_DN1620_c0_g1_i2.p2 TRINITY_DN1620_c0_g1~~TRINITY_DN1620_c0_g1_i2.p2  ORF type:complete len:161 (+),score=28.41 TRINITY_DN1620_c0_g1_i2:571-1053(+)